MRRKYYPKSSAWDFEEGIDDILESMVSSIGKTRIQKYMSSVRNESAMKILTSDFSDIELDAESLVENAPLKEPPVSNPDTSDVASAGFDKHQKNILDELDQLIFDANQSAVSAVSKETTKKSKTYVSFCLVDVNKKKFMFQADLRQTAIINGRMTYRILMAPARAIRLMSFYQRVGRAGKERKFGIRLDSIKIKCHTPNKEIHTSCPIPRTKAEKISIYKLAGVEVRHSVKLKNDKVVVLLNFNTSG